MNCHEFELASGELASERLMDAAQREDALGHAAACAGCGSRLADERALTEGLRFIAGTANEEAPARVEAALLAAFKERPARAVAPIGARRRRWLYAAASAAAIALIVTLLAFVVSRSRGPEQPQPKEAITQPPAVPDQQRVIPAPQQESPAVTRKDLARNKRRPVDRVNNASRRQLDRPHGPASEAEIATDFIPLMNREGIAQMDGGQLMRVELPRSALMSFGLPMDMERATERIKADVVVGNDGLARAIRFVR